MSSSSSQTSQDKVLYSIARYLSNLKGKGISKNDDDIDTIITLLESSFGSVIEDNTENFKNQSYYPIELNEIFDAGVDKLEIQMSKDAINKANEDPKFIEFTELVTSKGFFNGCEEGSLDYLQRQAKLVNKFNKKTVTVQAANVAEKEKEADEKKTLGNTAIANKDYPEAIRYYTEAIELLPNGASSHVYYCNRAAAYCYLNQHEFSIEDCESAIKLNDKYAKAYSRLGLSNFFLGRYEEAVSAYEKLVELEPTNTNHQDELRKAKKKLDKKSLASSSNSSLGRSTSNNGTAAGAGGAPPAALDGLLKNPQMKNAFDKMGGLEGLSEIMKDPAMMAMAQNMMKDPKMMQQAMSMMGGAGGGGGPAGDLPDLSALMGGAAGGGTMNDDGAGAGAAGAPSSSSSSGGKKKKQPFKGFEDA